MPGLVLDIGSGGGWPAKDIVARTGRSVVAMDMVLGGLQVARTQIKDAGMPEEGFKFVVGAVSYTHLTLPTICSV